MPQSPADTSLRLTKEYGLTKRDIQVLMTLDAGNTVGVDGTVNPGVVTMFESIARGRDPRLAYNWYNFPRFKGSINALQDCERADGTACVPGSDFLPEPCNNTTARGAARFDIRWICYRCAHGRTSCVELTE